MENVTLFTDKNEMARGAARNILQMVQKSIQKNGICRLVLTGGRTPIEINEQIVKQAKRYQIDWSLVHFFWGDERCVPPDHVDSNYKMNYNSLLVHLPVSDANIHRIKTELDAKSAAELYETELIDCFALKKTDIPKFDIILLGMGLDGHTASLFPGTSALTVKNRLVVENYVDKLNTYRVTMTYPVINHAACVVFLVSGKEKKSMVEIIWNGERDFLKYPAQNINPIGELLWWVDS